MLDFYMILLLSSVFFRDCTAVRCLYCLYFFICSAFLFRFCPSNIFFVSQARHPDSFVHDSTSTVELGYWPAQRLFFSTRAVCVSPYVPYERALLFRRGNVFFCILDNASILF